MYNVRESWTDERMDDFARNVERRFDKVDREMDRRFDKVDHELHRVNDRLDGMHRLMMHAVVALYGSTLAGFLVLTSLILTQR